MRKVKRCPCLPPDFSCQSPASPSPSCLLPASASIHHPHKALPNPWELPWLSHGWNRLQVPRAHWLGFPEALAFSRASSLVPGGEQSKQSRGDGAEAALAKTAVTELGGHKPGQDQRLPGASQADGHVWREVQTAEPSVSTRQGTLRTGRAPAQALAPSSRTLPWGSRATSGAPDSLTPTLSGLAGLPRASGLSHL